MEEQRVTSTEPLLVDRGNDGVTVVRLNRPDALNAANEQLHGAIAEVWSELAGDPGCRAAVITGAGTAFSAGGDLGLLERMVSDGSLRATAWYRMANPCERPATWRCGSPACLPRRSARHAGC